MLASLRNCVAVEKLHLGMTWFDMGWGEMVGWLAAAVLKFLVTPSAMVARGIPFLGVWLTSTAGAWLGVGVFWNFGKWLFGWWEAVRGPRSDRGKQVFTPARRRFVRWKNRLGVTGLMLISGFISVPVATMLAAKYFRDDPWTLAKLMVAFSLWALLLTALSEGVKWLAT
jgi:hypothetical protein